MRRFRTWPLRRRRLRRRNNCSVHFRPSTDGISAREGPACWKLVNRQTFSRDLVRLGNPRPQRNLPRRMAKRYHKFYLRGLRYSFRDEVVHATPPRTRIVIEFTSQTSNLESSMTVRLPQGSLINPLSFFRCG